MNEILVYNMPGSSVIQELYLIPDSGNHPLEASATSKIYVKCESESEVAHVAAFMSRLLPSADWRWVDRATSYRAALETYGSVHLKVNTATWKGSDHEELTEPDAMVFSYVRFIEEIESLFTSLSLPIPMLYKTESPATEPLKEEPKSDFTLELLATNMASRVNNIGKGDVKTNIEVIRALLDIYEDISREQGESLTNKPQ